MRLQILNLRSRNQICEKINYFFENYVISEGAVSHYVLFHQPLPITRHQERFYANNYFEYLPLTGVPCIILAWLLNVAMFDNILQENLDSRINSCPFTWGTFCEIL